MSFSRNRHQNFNENFFSHWKNLGWIVAAALGAIFFLAICSENYMSSDGFQIRKDTFACLVQHLEEKNVADEYFGVAESFDISTVDCKEIVQQKNESFYSDLRARLQSCASVYNVTSAECEVLNNPICTVSEIIDQTDAICFSAELTTMLAVKDSGHEESLKAYKRSKKDCGELSTCFDCMMEKLAAMNYEEARFHATAVNLTVIEFQIWKYFSISPRVKELANEVKKLEAVSMRECEDEKKCSKDVACYK